MFRKFLYIFLISLVALLLVMYIFSPQIYNAMLDNSKKQAGLIEKTIMIDDHEIVYYEGGQGESIIMLHGFGGDKDNWIPFAIALKENYHVIALDLPGFGESTKNLNTSYNSRKQAERLDKFREALSISEFHVVGNSLGGYVAQIYATQYPEQVKTLALFAPFGLEWQKELLNSNYDIDSNPLLVDTVEDYEILISKVFAKSLWIPQPIKIVLANEASANRELFKQILLDTNENFFPLEELISDIQAPVLFIWGEEDEILDIKALEHYKELYKDNANLKIVILNECGHVPMIEKIDKSQFYYKKFLQEYKA